MKKYIHMTFLLLLLTAISGVWLRAFGLWPSTTMPYDNVLHAHSHLALIGWLFIAAFLIFLLFYKEDFQHKIHPKLILMTLIVTSLFMFLAFLYQGYGILSVALSTLHIFVEYWAVVYVWLNIRNRKMPGVAKLFIIGGLIANVVSSLGPYVLAYLSATQQTHLALFDVAVYFYLHFQYNGWLTLFLIGMFLLFLDKMHITVNNRLIKFSFLIYFIALFPGFLISALWVGLGPILEIVASVASVGQWVAVILFLVALKNGIKQIYVRLPRLSYYTLMLALFLFILKSTMELGLISPTLADLVNNTRDVIIGYLHLTLLGFLTLFVLFMFQKLGVIQKGRFSIISFIIFTVGFLLNELLLFLNVLGDWTNWYRIPAYPELLFVAAITLFVGVIMIWLNVNWAEKKG